MIDKSQGPQMDPSDIYKMFPGLDPSKGPVYGINDPKPFPPQQGTPINGPQPVPGMPPRAFDGPVIGSGFPGGSGQPINQPMNPNQGHVTPFAGPGWDYNYDPTTGRGTQTDASGKTTDYNYPASQLPQGSLQSLGGGWVPGQPDFMGGTPLTADNMQQQLQAARSIGQSGMVTLRGTDGTTKPVPAGDVAHWLSRGAVRV
jgi:hypothetical protein